MGTVTFLFTDIEGSTALLRRLGDDAYAQVLAGHHELIRSALAAHGGEEVDTQGDAFFAAFTSARACAVAALEMQEKLAAHAWPDGGRVQVRIGMHTGEATRTVAGWVGLDVHRAARIAAIAHGGQVVLSEQAASLVRDNLPAAAALTDLGLHRLKDLGHPERIFQLHAVGMRTEFPALRSLGNPALLNNLPAELTSFIGRDRELTEVRALVQSSRLVTMTGPGGCGKTRLGLQLAAELLDGSGDGVWLVELAAVSDEDAVAPAICQALRITAQPARPALDALLEALRPQDILILLDNCEHLIGACAKIADALLRRCPKAHVIATSREPLGISGETIYRVPSLSLPESAESASLESFDSVALFMARARAQGVDLRLDSATGPIVVSICRRLDGLPLAIELATARLRSMSLTELSDRLDQRFRLLTGGSRTALERQQTLRAAIGWSYSLLSPAEQILLLRLPVFADSFDLAATEAVCAFGDLDPLDVADMLRSLVDKSLVVAEQAGVALRYRLLETIRQYAAERLADGGGERGAAAVAAEHCAYYLGLVETAARHLTGPDQARWILRLDTDNPNVRRAMEYAVQSAEATAQVLRFAVALRRYVMVRNEHEEAVIRLLLPVLSRPAARDDLKLFGAALTAAAYSAPLIDPATTELLAEQAIQVARQLDDNRMIIESLTVRVHLSSYYAHPGDAARGSILGRESIDRSRELGDDVLLAESILECLYYYEFVEWDGLFAEAIESTRRSGDLFTRGLLHDIAANRAAMAEDIAGARAHLEEAARIHDAFGQQPSWTIANFGILARTEGNLEDAQLQLERALLMYRRDGDQVGIAWTILGLACLRSDRGDWERAAQLHGAAQILLDRKGAEWDAPAIRHRQESLTRIRAHIGDEKSDVAQARGAALSFDEAFDLALSHSIGAA